MLLACCRSELHTRASYLPFYYYSYPSANTISDLINAPMRQCLFYVFDPMYWPYIKDQSTKPANALFTTTGLRGKRMLRGSEKTRQKALLMSEKPVVSLPVLERPARHG